MSNVLGGSAVLVLAAATFLASIGYLVVIVAAPALDRRRQAEPAPLPATGSTKEEIAQRLQQADQFFTAAGAAGGTHLPADPPEDEPEVADVMDVDTPAVTEDDRARLDALEGDRLRAEIRAAAATRDAVAGHAREIELRAHAEAARASHQRLLAEADAAAEQAGEAEQRYRDALGAAMEAAEEAAALSLRCGLPPGGADPDVHPERPEREEQQRRALAAYEQLRAVEVPLPPVDVRAAFDPTAWAAPEPEVLDEPDLVAADADDLVFLAADAPAPLTKQDARARRREDRTRARKERRPARTQVSAPTAPAPQEDPVDAPAWVTTTMALDGPDAVLSKRELALHKRADRKAAREAAAVERRARKLGVAVDHLPPAEEAEEEELVSGATDVLSHRIDHRYFDLPEALPDRNARAEI